MEKRSFYKIFSLSILFSFLFISSYGQIAITDSSSCQDHNLHAAITGTIPTASGIVVDDGYSGLIPIGFTFNFYGTNYTQLLIGSNGVVQFTASLAGGYCPWSIGAPLLGNTNMLNAICGPWCDIYIIAGGSITYSTLGTAPNRKFAVTWCGTHMYSCTSEYTTSQIIIYESSNLVEVHTSHKTACSWNGGYAITGVQNAAGTIATTAPGRDYPSVWTVTSPPEAWSFTPSGSTYTVASIPYSPAPYATSAIYWFDSSTGAAVGTGPYLTVTPTVPTTYVAVALGCNSDSTKAYFHVDPSVSGSGGAPHIDSAYATNPTACGMCDGTIVLHGVNPHQVDTVIYSYNGVPQPRYVDSAAADSTITLSHLCGGVYDYIYVKVDNCPSNQKMVTLVTPILAISAADSTNPTVCGKSDGTIILHGLTPLQPYTLTYARDGVGQPPLAGYVAADSTITITGLDSAIYTSLSVTIGLCTATWPMVKVIDPSPFPADFTFTTGLGCNGDTVFVTNTSAPSGYYSYWNYDGAGFDSLHTSHIYADQLNPTPYVGDYSITLTYNTTSFHKANCQTTKTLPVHFDHQIAAYFTQDHDTICHGMPISFTNNTVHTNPATYAWNFGDDTGTSTQASPEYTYPMPSATSWTTTLVATDSLVGCTSTYTHSSNVILVTLKAPNDTTVCLRDSMKMRTGELTVIGASEDIATYEWTMADGSPATNLSNPAIDSPYFFGIGDFTYELTVGINPAPDQLPAGGCVAHADQTIHSKPPLTLTDVTSSPQVIEQGHTVQLNANGARYYTWTPNNGTVSDPNIRNPIATPTDSATTYVVHGMTEYGCVDSATVTVYVDYDNTVFIATAFTPNGDGKNDKFNPAAKFKFQKLVEMRMYNRWGQVLFQSSSAADGWDGTFNGIPQDMGAYSYEVIVARPDGTQKVYKGTVTLIR